MKKAEGIRRQISEQILPGQMVYSSVTSESKTRLNLNSFGKGTYFLKLNSGNNEQSIKLLKIR
jgi:hypothetical protein